MAPTASQPPPWDAVLAVSFDDDHVLTTRDYLDLVALAERLGVNAPAAVLELDEYYEDQVGPGGRRIATQLVKQLTDPAPYDLDAVDLLHYRDLVPRWRDWNTVVQDGRSLAGTVLDRLAGESR